ncbi:hypothetical protein CCP3SC1AL1_110046 [Gammaproteobacteria bacterium]
MPEEPEEPVEEPQLIKYVADLIAAITDLNRTVEIELATGATNALIVKSNGTTYKQKVYVNGTLGAFTSEFSFMVLSPVIATDGEASALEGTKPLFTIANYFDSLNVSALDIGEKRIPIKIEMTGQPQDMTGVRTDGDITFFAVYTLTYRKTGA